MEKCVIKPRYESYWQGAGHNFIADTPGFREVMERDRFIALSGFLHLVDQTEEAVNKSDKIYKVRAMLDRMLPLFRRYYSPHQQLSLDEGMIPTKNGLAIKQYIRDKPVRWGIKSFLLGEAKTGYILDAEIYAGRVKDSHWPPSDQQAVLSPVSWRTRRSPTRTTYCSWTAFTTPSQRTRQEADRT